MDDSTFRNRATSLIEELMELKGKASNEELSIQIKGERLSFLSIRSKIGYILGCLLKQRRKDLNEEISLAVVFARFKESMTRVEIGAKQKGTQDCEKSLVGRFLSHTEISIFGISSLLCGRREVPLAID
ncbi:hypothetical protein M9H77_33935 [Catharanthus roseus]|uniref:Uncharacterized protein n=1 Tax=Catharanthus roseus TaxID=4058 RepID=A0ACB9ZK21_CATRO|nr:hypothetical protein M9H77_33935 [Catharanthus roseus]